MSARDKAVGLVGSKRPAPYWDSDSHSLICQAGTRRPLPGWP